MKDRVAVKIIEEVICAIQCKQVLVCRRGENCGVNIVRGEKFVTSSYYVGHRYMFVSHLRRSSIQVAISSVMKDIVIDYLLVLTK